MSPFQRSPFSVSIFCAPERGHFCWICLLLLPTFLSPLCPLSISPLSLKTYMKVTLNGSDTFRQLRRHPTLLRSRGSDSLTYLKKPWCNPLPNFLARNNNPISFKQSCIHPPADSFNTISLHNVGWSLTMSQTIASKTSLINHQSSSSFYVFQGVWCGYGWFNTALMRRMWSWIGNE